MPTSENRIPLDVRMKLATADAAAGLGTFKSRMRYYQRIGTVTGTQKRGVGNAGSERLASLQKSKEFKSAVSSVKAADRKRQGERGKKERYKRKVRKSVQEYKTSVSALAGEKVVFIRSRSYPPNAILVEPVREIYKNPPNARPYRDAVEQARSCWDGEQDAPSLVERQQGVTAEYDGERADELMEVYQDLEPVIVRVVVICREAGNFQIRIQQKEETDSKFKTEKMKRHYLLVVTLAIRGT